MRFVHFYPPSKAKMMNLETQTTPQEDAIPYILFFEISLYQNALNCKHFTIYKHLSSYAGTFWPQKYYLLFFYYIYIQPPLLSVFLCVFDPPSLTGAYKTHIILSLQKNVCVLPKYN
jgi:hypothetical protein